jgi:hypothetical protein
MSQFLFILACFFACAFFVLVFVAWTREEMRAKHSKGGRPEPGIRLSGGNDKQISAGDLRHKER